MVTKITWTPSTCMMNTPLFLILKKPQKRRERGGENDGVKGSDKTRALAIVQGPSPKSEGWGFLSFSTSRAVPAVLLQTGPCPNFGFQSVGQGMMIAAFVGAASSFVAAAAPTLVWAVLSGSCLRCSCSRSSPSTGAAVV
ncbi:MAG: hypothetical protein JOS17DRAFT_728507 [Linnemannia elongata]|nr:MAG: hypothetical protein JOS17DRAFT_728507 [Linnemannia elongata]